MVNVSDLDESEDAASSQKRTTATRGVLVDFRDRSDLVEEKVIEISANGNVMTTVTQEFILVEGEAISSLKDITGVCQRRRCQQPLTIRTFRACVVCGFVGCPRHCRLAEGGKIWLCRGCRWKRRLKRFGRLLLTPILGSVHRRKYEYV